VITNVALSTRLSLDSCHRTHMSTTTIKELKPIPENPPRWKPNSDPAFITVPGLDTTASVTDQIDQIDQLITLKLQVSLRVPLSSRMFLSWF